MRDKKIILTIVGVLTLSVLIIFGLSKLPFENDGPYMIIKHGHINCVGIFSSKLKI